MKATSSYRRDDAGWYDADFTVAGPDTIRFPSGVSGRIIDFVRQSPATVTLLTGAEWLLKYSSDNFPSAGKHEAPRSKV